MRKKKLITFLLLFIGIFGFRLESQAEGIYTNGWDSFGVNEQDYKMNLSRPYLAEQIGGYSNVDLRKDIVSLAYIGENLFKDLFLNSNNINTYDEVRMVAGDQITVKKMGNYQGRYIELRITVYKPGYISIDREAPLKGKFFKLKNLEYNGGADTQYGMTMHYQDTGEVIKLPAGKYFFININNPSVREYFSNAFLVDAATKVIGGNKNVLEVTKTKYVPSDGIYRLAVGKPLYNGSSSFGEFFFGLLIQGGRPFYFGLQLPIDTGGSSIRMFESAEKLLAVPLPYNNVSVSSSIRWNEKDMNHQVTIQLPNQKDDSFFPSSLRLNLGYNAKDYAQGTLEIVRGDTNTTIGSSEYSYSSGVLSLPKAFLKNYQGKEVRVKYVTTIDYSSPRIVEEYFNQGTKKFYLPYSVEVLSKYDSFNRTDFRLTKTDTLTYPLELTGTKTNSQVAIGKTTTDYPIETFLKDIKSNFPDDTVKTSMPLIAFTQEGEVEIPITLESTKLGIKKVITVTTKAKDIEFTFKQVPKSMSLNLNLGNRDAYPVLDQELSITDNRGDAKWKLAATVSKLVNAENAKELNGRFYYKSVDWTVEIPSETKTTILIGNSPTDGTNTVPISSTWNKNNGLYYQTENLSNYRGLYKGTITWLLEDAPG